MLVFSHRVPADLEPNPLACLLRVRAVPFDLTGSNPTRCGLPYPPALLESLAAADGLEYRPAPLGLAVARQAVAATYRARGVDVPADRIVVTASSSESYAMLLKLLCDPGDAVLVPAPSYPLLAHLATLEGVCPVRYRLEPEAAWQPVPPAAPPPRVRGVIAVHPNNPTGSVLDPRAASALVEAGGGVPLIVDEVFLDYPLGFGPAPATFATRDASLTFTLGGLSKSVGLPQLKLSWVVVSGPPVLVAAALARLEFIADASLSVGTPVQLAAPMLLRDGAAVRDAIRSRCRANLAELQEAIRPAAALTLLPPGAGWSAVLRYPWVVEEETLVLELVERDGVLVYPGYFFDFPRPGYLVVSLLPEPAVFAVGVRRLVARLVAHCFPSGGPAA